MIGTRACSGIALPCRAICAGTQRLRRLGDGCQRSTSDGSATKAGVIGDQLSA
jgi:hypothetical protein